MKSYKGLELFIDAIANAVAERLAEQLKGIVSSERIKPTPSVEDENYKQGWIDGNNADRTERIKKLLDGGYIL